MPTVGSVAEAFALLARWRDSRTPLRVRAELFPAVFDLEGAIGSADPPFIVLFVKDRGTAEILLEGEWHFIFGEPDHQGGSVSNFVGGSSSGKKRYEFGKTLIASKRDGSKHSILFMEILGQIIERD